MNASPKNDSSIGSKTTQAYHSAQRADRMGGGSETLITDAIGFDSYNQQATGKTSKPLTNKATDTDHTPVVVSDYVVRRLTPVECERLQAFPDGWTDIGEWTDTNGKKHTTADSARYKALGNSICTAAWVDILQSIADRIPEGEEKTMASLFSGIGGFELIWERDCGGKTMWASEIEEFCIAVTERRFNEDRSLIGSRSQAVNVERERERERERESRVFDARGNGNGNASPTITGGHQCSISDYTSIAVEKSIR